MNGYTVAPQSKKGRGAMKQIKKQLKWTLIGVTALLFSIGFLWWAQTSDKITTTDKKYIVKILEYSHIKPPLLSASEMSYMQQIHFIREAQHAVLAIAPTLEAIPFYHLREPKNLYQLKLGFCFDRSRSIEKALRAYGFKTLHIALYSTTETHSKLTSLLTPAIPSHAISEVLTKKGWLVLDSNSPWISLTTNNTPISIAKIQKTHARLNWKYPIKKVGDRYMYIQDFTYVVGLYSRTGKLFPPYPAPFPNINWKEFTYNF